MTAAHFIDASIALIFGAFAAITVLIALLMADDRRHIRHGRLPLQPLEPIDLGHCPWCQVRECMDVSSCTCDGPCGMPLCQALGSEVAS